jgi:argininosuccinate lyase
MGFVPVLITASPERYSYLAQDATADVIVVPVIDENALYQLLDDRSAGAPDIVGITSTSEYYVATAAALAERFALPGPDSRCVRAARDKSRQREVLGAAGLPIPAFQVVASASEAIAAAREIGCPVVVKPLSGSGSVGVRACATDVEAGRQAGVLLSSALAQGERRVLVEAFIDGPEFSVEMFSGRVVGITRKHLGAWPNFVETGHDYPALVPADTARVLADTATRATALLGLAWGPLHWEFRIRNGQAVAMEVNPRLAGGFIPELVRRAQGIDLIRETLHVVTGGAPNLEPRRCGHASIRFLFAPHAGCFAHADGVDEARALAGISEVALYRARGDELTIEGDFRDRIGHVIATACGGEVASCAAEGARDTIQIRVEAMSEAVL